MSTNAYIGVLQTTGSVKSVYLHWDGYPEHALKTLRSSYNSEDAATALIEHGAISVLGPDIGAQHDFDEHNDNVCTFYHRDRDEDLDIDTDANEAEFKKSCAEYSNYGYLFKNGSWTQVNRQGE